MLHLLKLSTRRVAGTIKKVQFAKKSTDNEGSCRTRESNVYIFIESLFHWRGIGGREGSGKRSDFSERPIKKLGLVKERRRRRRRRLMRLTLPRVSFPKETWN